MLQLGGRHIEVTGAGYGAGVTFIEKGRRVNSEEDKQLSLASRLGALCNDAGIGHGTEDTEIYGDST